MDPIEAKTRSISVMAEKGDFFFFCRKENMNLIFLTSLCISVSGVKCRENTQSSDGFSCPVLKKSFSSVVLDSNI